MGSIVSFLPRPAPPKPAERAEGGLAGAIIIFPGVRYERQPEPDEAVPFQAAQSVVQMPLR